MLQATRHLLVCLAAALLLVACKPKGETTADENSNDIAEEQNDKKFGDKSLEKEADFVADAVATSYAEIKMAQLARGKSGNAEVKAVADLLEKDHTKALEELKQLAQYQGVTIPVEEKDAERDDVNDLASKDAGDFDKAWCKELLKSHEKTIKDFEARAERAAEGPLKDWINKTLPTLRNHLDRLKTCETNLAS